MPASQSEEIVKFGPLSLNTTSRMVRWNNEDVVRLRKQRARFLEVLIRRQGDVASRDSIRRAIRPDRRIDPKQTADEVEAEKRDLDTPVYGLRAELGSLGSLVVTTGDGFQLVLSEARPLPASAKSSGGSHSETEYRRIASAGDNDSLHALSRILAWGCWFPEGDFPDVVMRNLEIGVRYEFCLGTPDADAVVGLVAALLSRAPVSAKWRVPPKLADEIALIVRGVSVRVDTRSAPFEYLALINAQDSKRGALYIRVEDDTFLRLARGAKAERMRRYFERPGVLQSGIFRFETVASVEPFRTNVREALLGILQLPTADTVLDPITGPQVLRIPPNAESATA